ncbi:hypothetical protein K488DRAFT_75090 [Vararia minispora EC-137]|uniref:Uncharacterized protein n=1 Tax=Vararia minispora EC-137 TaxID=1314806 RepID=A0ACB8Q505_9AGAM|nr:hypothetical protein K488DRAFT_75090 [Vararia minispora EC-137]
MDGSSKGQSGQSLTPFLQSGPSQTNKKEVSSDKEPGGGRGTSERTERVRNDESKARHRGSPQNEIVGRTAKSTLMCGSNTQQQLAARLPSGELLDAKASERLLKGIIRPENELEQGSESSYKLTTSSEHVQPLFSHSRVPCKFFENFPLSSFPSLSLLLDSVRPGLVSRLDSDNASVVRISQNPRIPWSSQQITDSIFDLASSRNTSCTASLARTISSLSSKNKLSFSFFPQPASSQRIPIKPSTKMRERPSFERWLSGCACAANLDNSEASSGEPILVWDLPVLVERCDNSPPAPRGITAIYNNTLSIHAETGYRLGVGEFRDQSGQPTAHHELLLVRPRLTFVDDPARLADVLHSHGYEGTEVTAKDRNLITTVHVDGCMFFSTYGPIGDLRKEQEEQGFKTTAKASYSDDEEDPSDELPTHEALTSLAYANTPRACVERSLADYTTLAREAYEWYEDGKTGLAVSIKDLRHMFAIEPAAERGLSHSLDGVFVGGYAQLKKDGITKPLSFFGARARIITRTHAQATVFHEVSARSPLQEAAVQRRAISSNLAYAIRRTPYDASSKIARIFKRVVTPNDHADADSEDLEYEEVEPPRKDTPPSSPRQISPSLPALKKLLYSEDEDAVGSDDEEMMDDLPRIRGYTSALGKERIDSAEKLLGGDTYPSKEPYADTPVGNGTPGIPDLWQATMYYKVTMPRSLRENDKQPPYISKETARTIDRAEIDNLLLSKFPEWARVAKLDSTEYCQLLENTMGIKIEDRKTLLPFHHPDNPLRIDTTLLPDWLKMQIRAGELNPNATVHQLLDHTASKFLAPSSARWPAIKADAFDCRGVLRFWHGMHTRLTALDPILDFEYEFLSAHFAGAHIRLLHHMRRNLEEISRVVRHIHKHLMIPISLLVLQCGKHFADEIIQGIPGHRSLTELIRDAPETEAVGSLPRIEPESRPWSPVSVASTSSSARTYDQIIAKALSEPLVMNPMLNQEDHHTTSGKRSIFPTTWLTNTSRSYFDPGNPLNSGPASWLPKYLAEGRRIGRLTELSSAIDFTRYILERRTIGAPEHYHLLDNPREALELDTFMNRLNSKAIEDRLCYGGDTFENQQRALEKIFNDIPKYIVGLSPTGYQMASFGITQIFERAGPQPWMPSSMPSLESLSDALDSASDMSISSSVNESRHVPIQRNVPGENNRVYRMQESCVPQAQQSKEQLLRQEAIQNMLKKPPCARKEGIRTTSANLTPPPPVSVSALEAVARAERLVPRQNGLPRMERKEDRVLKILTRTPAISLKARGLGTDPGGPLREGTIGKPDEEMMDIDEQEWAGMIPRNETAVYIFRSMLNPRAEPFVPRQHNAARVYSVQSLSVPSSTPFPKETEPLSRLDFSPAKSSVKVEPLSPMAFAPESAPSHDDRKTGTARKRVTLRYGYVGSGYPGKQGALDTGRNLGGKSRAGQDFTPTDTGKKQWCFLDPIDGQYRVAPGPYLSSTFAGSVQGASSTSQVLCPSPHSSSGACGAKEPRACPGNGWDECCPALRLGPLREHTQPTMVGTFPCEGSAERILGIETFSHGTATPSTALGQECDDISATPTIISASQPVAPISSSPNLTPPGQSGPAIHGPTHYLHSTPPHGGDQHDSRNVTHSGVSDDPDPVPSPSSSAQATGVPSIPLKAPMVSVGGLRLRCGRPRPYPFYRNGRPISLQFPDQARAQSIAAAAYSHAHRPEGISTNAVVFTDIDTPVSDATLGDVYFRALVLHQQTIIHIIELLIVAFEALLSQLPSAASALFDLDRILAQQPFRASASPLSLPAPVAPQFSRINPFVRPSEAALLKAAQRYFASTGRVAQAIALANVMGTQFSDDWIIQPLVKGYALDRCGFEGHAATYDRRIFTTASQLEQVRIPR